MGHESAHACLDPLFYKTNQWEQAKAADGKFISSYAKNYPDREDVAESATAWYAVRIRTNRQPVSDVELTESTIPNRMNLFDDILECEDEDTKHCKNIKSRGKCSQKVPQKRCKRTCARCGLTKPVKCGGHQAASCLLCPHGNGALWCNGDCMWDGSKCIMKG